MVWISFYEVKLGKHGVCYTNSFLQYFCCKSIILLKCVPLAVLRIYSDYSIIVIECSHNLKYFNGNFNFIHLH